MAFNGNKPYEKLDGGAKGADFVRQDGVIYAWSESNCDYELAWWVYPDANDNPLKQSLLRERPLPPGVVI